VTLLVHILAGGLALVAGFIALFAAKGARLHRRSGRWFVGAMLVMSLLGALIAAVRAGEASVVAGLLTAYLVTTALVTVRPVAAESRGLDLGLMTLALALGLASLGLGFETLGAPGGKEDGIPAGMFFVFGSVALLAGFGDARTLRSGGLRGAPRLARHLWRMGFALWIASASFFLGQADEFPEALRAPALLAIPVLVPLLAIVYWLWRLRIRRSSRGIVGATSPETA